MPKNDPAGYPNVRRRRRFPGGNATRTPGRGGFRFPVKAGLNKPMPPGTKKRPSGFSERTATGARHRGQLPVKGGTRQTEQRFPRGRHQRPSSGSLGGYLGQARQMSGKDLRQRVRTLRERKTALKTDADPKQLERIKNRLAAFRIGLSKDVLGRKRERKLRGSNRSAVALQRRLGRESYNRLYGTEPRRTRSRGSRRPPTKP